jgi:hypothetical protein
MCYEGQGLEVVVVMQKVHAESGTWWWIQIVCLMQMHLNV